MRKLLSMCTGISRRYALHQLSPTWLSLCLYPDIPVEFIVKFSLLYTVYLNIPVEFIVKFTAIQCLKLPMQKSQKRYSVYSRYSTLVEQAKPAGYVCRASRSLHCSSEQTTNHHHQPPFIKQQHQKGRKDINLLLCVGVCQGRNKV